MEFTDNGVGYTWELAGSAGAAFVLHPLKCKHSPSDVAAAKKELRDNRDVVTMHTEWVDSYRGELFKAHREYVRHIQGLKKQISDNLSPANLANWNTMNIQRQRYMVWQLMDSDAFTWKIGNR